MRLYAMLAVATAGAITFAGQALASPSASRSGPQVLLVCNGSTTPCPTTTTPPYTTVQDAVNAAKPGDWILIWPGVYHESGGSAWDAGVYVPKSARNLHIRGLNRNTVIIDGSKGTAGSPCPSAPSLQNYGPGTSTTGWDGLVVAASDVTVQNLTVCDYLSGTQGHGNEIWWNGGDGSGKIGIDGYLGSYLSATSEYNPAAFNDPHFAQYGIFVSNSAGPGAITHSYASNMADAAYYVGACQRVCDTVLSRDVGTNSSLGYSGTNSGGRLVIEDSLFLGNRTGLAPNSLNNDDAPPPQDGRCPHSNRSCLVIQDNLILDNNNPNVPASGLTPAIGAGVEISGGKYDTVRFNVIKNQGSWGVVTHDYPDFETPPPGSHCQGGTIVKSGLLKGACLFPAKGNRIYGNVFFHDGFFANPSNSDVATETLHRNTPRNCFYANHARLHGHWAAPTSSPAHIERASVDGPPCGQKGTGNVAALFSALLCATDFLGLPCAKNQHYPQPTTLKIVPLPRLRSMPHPCLKVPANEFCPPALGRQH